MIFFHRLRRYGSVELDEKRRITNFKANNGDFTLKGSHDDDGKQAEYQKFLNSKKWELNYEKNRIQLENWFFAEKF